MATYSVEQVEAFGKGVLKSEGVVVDKDHNVYGGGRNGHSFPAISSRCSWWHIPVFAWLVTSSSPT